MRLPQETIVTSTGEFPVPYGLEIGLIKGMEWVEGA